MQIRAATVADLATLVDLMRGYYRDDDLVFDPEQSRATLQRLLEEPQWGRVWLGTVEDVAAGYLVLCIGFSLELGGNEAFIDEVFVQPGYRGRGFGRRLLEFAGLAARELGLRALHLEVDRGNASAQRLYSSLGYRARDRYTLMTLRP